VTRDNRITLRVSTAEKVQIEEWVEQDPDFETKSEFLRAAARDYAGDSETSIDPDQIVEAVDIAISPVHEDLEEIKNRIASVEAAATEPDDEVTRLAEQLAAELPVHPDGNLPDLAHEVPEDISEGSARAARILSNPTAWAAYFETEAADVRAALSLAQRWYPEVTFQQVKGTRRWYKTRDLHDHAEDN